MGQAKEAMGGVPMPHEALQNPSEATRMAGSALMGDSDPGSGLDAQKSGGYGAGSISKEPRSKYLQKASGAQSF
jgi:hypothetical protein|tara:strand:+ start:473 stop:694 length:222 start_codon:yes stop_codon:yes gene_type:complete